ncbi:hypothetical protein SBBP1_940022 [Burkholderiales bacterium]|nr:hypothetical protein SBBP1_940022 [Burkholderiales bacterium]
MDHMQTRSQRRANCCGAITKIPIPAQNVCKVASAQWGRGDRPAVRQPRLAPHLVDLSKWGEQ